MRKQVVVITSNVGNRDFPCPMHPKISIRNYDIEHIKLPRSDDFMPQADLPNRLKAKFYRAQCYRFFPDANFIIWHDHTIHIEQWPEFCMEILRYLDSPNVNVVVNKHSFCDTVQDEINYIKDLMSVSEQHKEKYENQNIEFQETFFNYAPDFGTRNVQSYELGIIGFNLENDVLLLCDMLDDWWDFMITYTAHDQISFPFFVNEGVVTMPHSAFDDNGLWKFFDHQKHSYN